MPWHVYVLPVINIPFAFDSADTCKYSCPASTVNFFWFTDDKLLKFYHCSHKKRLKQTLLHTCEDSLTSNLPARQWTSILHLQNGLVYVLWDAWFHAPMLLSADTMNIFIGEPDKVHHQIMVANDSTSWDKQACTHDTLWRQHYIRTSKNIY